MEKHHRGTFWTCSPRFQILLHNQNVLGWRLCRTKLPRNIFNAKKKKQKILSPVQPPESLSPALFHSFAPAISNTIARIISNCFAATRICRHLVAPYCAISRDYLSDTPLIARYGFLVSAWPIGCDAPSPFSGRFPLGEHAKWRCDTAPPPPRKGYLSDACPIPYDYGPKKHGNGNVQAKVRANNSGQFEGIAHEMWGFEAKRARKFTRTSPRTLPWSFITMLSAPLI